MKLTDRQRQTIRLLLDKEVTRQLKAGNIREAQDAFEAYKQFDGYFTWEQFESFVKVEVL